MTLQNQSGYAYIKYRIDMSYVENVLHMLYDAIILEGGVDELSKIKHVFSPEKLLSKFSVKDEEYKDFDSFLMVVLNRIEDQILQGIQIKESSFIIYIDKREQNRIICSYVSSSGRTISSTMVGNEIENWIRATINIDNIVKEIVTPRYQLICNHICQLVAKSGKNKLVLCEELIPICAYPIQKDNLTLEGVVSVDVDPDAILFNPSFLLNVVNVKIDDYKIAEIQRRGETIGITIDDYFMPTIDVIEYINTDKKDEYLWQLINKVYGREHTSKLLSIELQTFLQSALSPSLNKILTNLRCNFYLPEDFSISRSYNKYFELVHFYNKIDHIDNLQVCTNTKTKGTNLGIYTPQKIENQYNLLHWYTTGLEQLEHYNSEEKKRVNTISKIKVLKPPYNYYLLHSYFEDVIAAFLNAIGVTYVRNVEFQYGSAQSFEADFIVRLDHKILVIEAKTRLSEITIKDALEKKVAVMRDKFGDTFMDYPISYLVCAQFSEESLGLMEHYVTRITKESRPSFNNLFAYDFYIGESAQGKINAVRCIAEPDLGRLQRKLIDICHA